jgi:hypothetical protein
MSNLHANFNIKLNESGVKSMMNLDLFKHFKDKKAFEELSKNFRGDSELRNVSDVEFINKSDIWEHIKELKKVSFFKSVAEARTAFVEELNKLETKYEGKDLMDQVEPFVAPSMHLFSIYMDDEVQMECSGKVGIPFSMKSFLRSQELNLAFNYFGRFTGAFY